MTEPALDAMAQMALADPVEAKLYVHELLNQEPGRFLLTFLKRYVNYGASPHTPGDPYTTAHRAGRQDVCALLVSLQQADPDALRAEKTPEPPYTLLPKKGPHDAP